MDCKATINLGDFSRGGKSRGTVPVEALDHDMATKSKLIPCILNLENDQLYIFYGIRTKPVTLSAMHLSGGGIW